MVSGAECERLQLLDPIGECSFGCLELGDLSFPVIDAGFEFALDVALRIHPPLALGELDLERVPRIGGLPFCLIGCLDENRLGQLEVA